MANKKRKIDITSPVPLPNHKRLRIGSSDIHDDQENSSRQTSPRSSSHSILNSTNAVLVKVQTELAQVRRQQREDRASVQAALDAQVAHIRRLQHILPGKHRENSSARVVEPTGIHQEIDDSDDEESKIGDQSSDVSDIYGAYVMHSNDVLSRVKL